jgi:hypothetical protein
MKLERYLSLSSMAVLLPHVFCCGLPFFSSLLSLSSTGSIALGGFLNLELIHTYEFELLIFAGVILAITALANLIGYIIDCRQHACVHDDCSSGKKSDRKIFLIACGVFVINVMMYVMDIGQQAVHTH